MASLEESIRHDLERLSSEELLAEAKKLAARRRKRAEDSRARYRRLRQDAKLGQALRDLMKGQEG